jgi:hypothetical protein
MIVRLSAALLATRRLTLVAIPTAAAQPAAAIGQPLPDATLRDGTVTVRVVAGDRSQPVTGVDVTVTLAAADGQGTPEEKTARTDAEGRATFTDIAMGTLVQGRSVRGEDAPIESGQFPMPQSGGIRADAVDQADGRRRAGDGRRRRRWPADEPAGDERPAAARGQRSARHRHGAAQLRRLRRRAGGQRAGGDRRGTATISW